MYARLVEIEGIDPSRREEALSNIRDTAIPMLKEVDGFAGFIALADADNRRARNVVLWETREGAEEAERRMAQRRDEMVTAMGATVHSADLYEALIVEVTEAARA